MIFQLQFNAIICCLTKNYAIYVATWWYKWKDGMEWVSLGGAHNMIKSVAVLGKARHSFVTNSIIWDKVTISTWLCMHMA